MRFKEVDPALERILMSEAHTFQREKGESINEYVKYIEQYGEPHPYP